MGKRAVFLDRDGTIIEESGYLSDPDGVTLLPGAADAIRRLAGAGFMIVVVTNQSGIARGYYGEQELDKVHNRLDAVLAEKGAKVDAYYHCPHHPDFGGGQCGCRKPATGMALLAASEHGIDLASSYFVGDKSSDVGLGINAGGTPLLVLTGYGAEERVQLEARGMDRILVFDGLAEAADWILEGLKGS